MEKIDRFRSKVLSYYEQSGRKLPWRQTTDPYKILVSEMMLQQTQVDRVVPYYEKWITAWPAVQDLANASRRAVLSTWMGLGYNTRAVNFHKTAQIITRRFKGDVLSAVGDFKALPGIGPYTARAVEIFAANKDVVTVDTNIRRIFIHEFGLDNPSDQELWSLAERCLPRGRSRDWHNALMDYGSAVLTSRQTGISPKTKQSRFQGSDRQVRARIVRYLLTNTTATVSALQKHTKTDMKRLLIILEGMKRDDLLVGTTRVKLKEAR